MVIGLLGLGLNGLAEPRIRAVGREVKELNAKGVEKVSLSLLVSGISFGVGALLVLASVGRTPGQDS